MSTIKNSSALPSAMEKKLKSIRFRQSLLAVLRAVAIGASVLIAAMVVSMIADWSFTLFNTGLRTALTVGSFALAVVALLATGVSPLMAAFRRTRAATNADAEVPQLEERWTTVATFATSDHQPTTATEKAMLQQVTSEAVAMERLVQPARVARPKSLRPAGLALGACGLVLAGFLATNWPQTSVLLQRFWSPTTDITATQLKSTTGDIEIPRGESLDLVTEVSGLPRDTAILEMETGSELFDVFELKPDENDSQTFVHSLSVDQSFRYRVRSGDGQTPWHTVTVIDYPAFEEVRLTVTAPDYVDRPPYEKTLIPSRIRVVQGSRLKLLMKPVDSLERLELALTFDADAEDNEPSQRLLTLTPDADGWYRFETQLLDDMSLSPTLFGSHGLTNEDKRVCRIQVIPDKVPVARIVSPSNEMAVAVDDVIDVKFEAHDDHGIATAELVVYDESATEDGGEPKILSVQPIPLDDQRLKKYVMATVQLDLKKLNLDEGTNISYAIRVTDNRNVQFDPKAMQAQTAETRPGESPLDDLENMLADARDPSGNRRPESDRNGQSNKNQPSQSRNENQTDTGTEEENADLPTGDASTVSDPTDNTDKSKQDEDKGKANSNENTPNGKPTGETPNGETAVAADENKPDAGKGEGTERKAKGKPTPGENENIAGEPKSDSDGDKPGRDAKSETPDRDTKNAKQILAQADSKTGGNQKENDSKQSNGDTSESQSKKTKNRNKSSENGSPRDKMVAMNPQQTESGQNAETTRRTLKITARLTAVAAASGRNADKMQIRDRVVRIDEMLAGVETALTKVVERNIPDADRSEQFRILDTQLGDIGKYVAELRNETKGRQFAFVGLQMVHISRTQVAPARDRIFIAIREPLGTDNPTNALHYVVRAREMLAALLKRYDRVAQDQELAKALDETVKMYEVYVEKMQQLMRERRQNRNPLQRKMEVVEVDQNYLDRYAEVLTLRREMMAEFGRMLGDDPRLLARYLDLVRRRRNSLRDQLSEVFERQDDISTELSGWLQVGKNQRDDLWAIVAEMRIHAATPLAKDAALLAERLEQALPLVLKEDQGTAALVIAHARQIVRISRSIAFDAKKFGQTDDKMDLVTNAEQLVIQFSELDAALEQLNFENEGNEDVSTYVDSRLLESRTVADQADEWSQIASHLEQKRYYGLAEVDQQKVAIVTELLRVEMLGMEDDLQNQFQQQVDSDLPGEIIDMIRELHRVMESITFNQAAATFAMTKNRLPIAELQQAKTMQGFQRAEKLFDLIRRATIAALDEYDPPDPNIADLRDPTLDQFLEQLEREPNIEAQLGIPGRPRNLRIIADSMERQQAGGDLLSDSGEAARQRAQKAQRMKMKRGKGKPEKPETEMTDEERKQREKAQQMQETLEKSLASIKEKLDDPKTMREQRRKLEQMAKNMKRMLDQMGERNPDDEEWKRIVESDKAKEVLRALASGKGIPDEQWNKLLSTLDDGLWQVRGRTPPEEYRKSIEQYQERIRQLLNTAGSGDE